MSVDFDFEPWPKIARLNRKIIITEKIDGTNAAIVVKPTVGDGAKAIANEVEGPGIHITSHPGEGAFSRVIVYAQSRKRVIAPSADNFGFAAWVRENAQQLADVLGVGIHFGEWYGSGIQRGYGLEAGDKRFALFNVKRWTVGDDVPDDSDIRTYFPSPWAPTQQVAALAGIGLTTVPVLGVAYSPLALVRRRQPSEDSYLSPGPVRTVSFIDATLDDLRRSGSSVAGGVGFINPEGIVIYHTQGNVLFKVTLEKDEERKGGKS